MATTVENNMKINNMKIEAHNRLSVNLFKTIACVKEKKDNNDSNSERKSCIVGVHGIINSFIPLAYGANGYSKFTIEDMRLKDAFVEPSIYYMIDGKPNFFTNVSIFDIEGEFGCINPTVFSTKSKDVITFANVAPEVRQNNLKKLNNQIEDLSKGLISEVITEKVLNETTSRLLIISKTEYRGFWEDRFELGSNENFNVSPQLQRQLRYIESFTDSVEFSKLGLKMDSQILKLPFKSKYYLLIVLPNKIVNNKEELMKIIEQLDWKELPSSFYTKNNNTIRITMPKFSFESKYNNLASKLSETGNKSTMGAAALFNSYRNLSQLFTNRKFKSEYIDMMSTSSINLDEHGVSTRSTTTILCTDCSRDKIMQIKINRPFAFFTVTNENILIDIGMFFGNK